MNTPLPQSDDTSYPAAPQFRANFYEVTYRDFARTSDDDPVAIEAPAHG